MARSIDVPLPHDFDTRGLEERLRTYAERYRSAGGSVRLCELLIEAAGEVRLIERERAPGLPPR